MDMTTTYEDVLESMWAEQEITVPSDEDWHWYMEVIYVDPAEMEDHR